jgi:formate dehydrogenase subunit delta
MSPDRLVHMANQIGSFFASQPHDKAVSGITDHIVKFWEPRMRASILEHYAKGGAGLQPLVKEAIGALAEKSQKPPQTTISGR